MFKHLLFAILKQRVLKIIVTAFSFFIMFMLVKNICLTESSEYYFVGYAATATILFWISFYSLNYWYFSQFNFVSTNFRFGNREFHLIARHSEEQKLSSSFPNIRKASCKIHLLIKYTSHHMISQLCILPALLYPAGY